MNYPLQQGILTWEIDLRINEISQSNSNTLIIGLTTNTSTDFNNGYFIHLDHEFNIKLTKEINSEEKTIISTIKNILNPKNKNNIS